AATREQAAEGRARNFKSGGHLLREGAQLKFLFISEKVARFPVRVMCKVLDVSPSGYYAWRSRPTSERARKDEQLELRIEAAHDHSRGIYGSPRVAAQLRAQGERVSTKRVARLMRQRRLQGRRRRRYRATTD